MNLSTYCEVKFKFLLFCVGNSRYTRACTFTWENHTTYFPKFFIGLKNFRWVNLSFRSTNQTFSYSYKSMLFVVGYYAELGNIYLTFMMNLKKYNIRKGCLENVWSNTSLVVHTWYFTDNHLMNESGIYDIKVSKCVLISNL